MPSPTLDKFKQDIQSLDCTANIKNQLLALAEPFYCEAIQEAADHIERHLDATVKDHPGDKEVLARAALIKGWLARIREEDLHLALTLHAGVEGEL